MQETLAVLFLQIVGVTMVLDVLALLYMRWFARRKIRAEAATIEHQTFRRLFLANFKNPFSWRKIAGRTAFALAYLVSVYTVTQ